MEQYTNLQNITGRGAFRTYKEPDSYELSGKNFKVNLKGLGLCELNVSLNTLSFCGKTTDYRCVKCEDAAYLLGFDGKTLFLNAETGEAVLADGEALYMSGEAGESPLTDWETNVVFAAFLSLPCRFDADSLTVGEDTWPAKYVTLADSLHFVEANTPDGALTLIIDTARFLVSGSLNGKLDVGGYVELPPKKAE